jgi:hypothetical protein
MENPKFKLYAIPVNYHSIRLPKSIIGQDAQGAGQKLNV